MGHSIAFAIDHDVAEATHHSTVIAIEYTFIHKTVNRYYYLL